MALKFEILDHKLLQESQWLMGKTNLLEYLKNLKPSFYEYIIQRKIVKNKYLNHLVNTVLVGEPVPLITLTTKVKYENVKRGSEINIDMDDVEILDGLQRTFRLWAYYKIIEEFNKHTHPSPLDFAKSIKASFPEFFESGIVSFSRIKEYYSDNFLKELEYAFAAYDLYFIIWGGLTESQVIHKMLVLNAGQRPVTLTHQFELLFLFVWEEVKDTSGITLYREKDQNAGKIKVGDRKVGEYMFSSVIAGLRSFLENKPKRISIEDFDLEDLQNQTEQKINEDIFTKPYILTFLNRLKTLDQAILDKEKDDGNKWFARETTISGLLAGLGKSAMVKEDMPIKEIENLTNEIFEKLIARIAKGELRLSEFQEEYANLQSRTVNVGSYLRTIIMDYIFFMLNNSPVSWKSLFNKAKK